MPSYTVLSVAPDTRQYEANGPKIAYKVRFTEHSDKEVEWSQNAATAPPQSGQSVDGSIDWDGKYGPKFKKEFAQNGFSGGGGGSTWKPKDPSEIAAIQRQHSQEMALRFAAISPAVGKALIEKSGKESLTAVIKPLVDWFQRDVTAGVKLAEKDTATASSYGQAKDTPLTGVSDVPVLPVPEHVPVPAGAEDLPF